MRRVRHLAIHLTRDRFSDISIIQKQSWREANFEASFKRVDEITVENVIWNSMIEEERRTKSKLCVLIYVEDDEAQIFNNDLQIKTVQF